jgi:hypothetical protein
MKKYCNLAILKNRVPFSGRADSKVFHLQIGLRYYLGIGLGMTDLLM